MREIKFRAWHCKKIREINFIDFYNETIDLNIDGVATTTALDGVNLMQYTGLKDKNGRDIFEGDVVRILYTDWVSKSEGDPRTLEQYKIDKSHIGVVTYSVDRFLLNFGEENEGRITEGTHGEKEVIGNIYENPELLNY